MNNYQFSTCLFKNNQANSILYFANSKGFNTDCLTNTLTLGYKTHPY